MSSMQPGPSAPMLPPSLPMSRLHLWQIQAVRDVLLIAAVVGLVWLGYAMRSVTVPLLIALTLAYLFEPLVSHLTQRFNTSRPMVVGGLLLTLGLAVLILLAIIVPLLIGQTIRFIQDVRAGRFETTALALKQYVPEQYQSDYERAVQWLMPDLVDDKPSVILQPQQVEESDVPESSAPQQEASQAQDEERLRQIVREEVAAHAAEAPSGVVWLDVARSTSRRVFDFLGRIVQLGLLAFLIPFYWYFFSVSYPAVVRFGREMIPISQRARTIELVHKMDRAVAGFVRGRILICLIMGVMLAIGWLIVGVPYSIVLGLLVGAFSIVPYLGGVGLPLAIGLLFFDQLQLPESQRMTWWAILLWPTVVFVIVQIVESYMLTPAIAGKATNLDPVTILVAVLAGGSVGGVYGMILAIPIAACLKILFTDVLLPKIRAWTRGDVTDPLPIRSA